MSGTTRKADLPRTIAPGTDLSAVATQALFEGLRETVEITARHVLRMALICAELERRGEDLQALRIGIVDVLADVATGRLVPEAVVQFAGHRTLLRHLSALPPDDQRAIAAGRAIPLVREGEDGTFEDAAVPATALRVEEVRRAFGPDGLRSRAQQIRLLASKPPTAASPRRERLRIDPATGCLKAGRRFVTAGGQRVTRDMLIDALMEDERRRNGGT